MAKEKEPVLGDGKAHIRACAPVWDGQQMAHIPYRPAKRAVARAHDKHKNDTMVLASNTHPTLGDSFHALPPELRSHIFSMLVVQPSKWNIPHHPDCLLRTVSGDITPGGHNMNLCADSHSADSWRMQSHNPNPWINPWRSQWAPPQTNAYVCSTCYDERLRSRPFPQAKSLPCLCARRQNLQTLLVCRRWYHEAGLVLYTWNTFAFEDSTTFVDFTINLPPLWRAKISKVSIMTPSTRTSESVIKASANLESQIWPLLRTLPSLAFLELDANFLSDTRSVHRMIRTGLRNLRKCSFVVRGTVCATQQGSEYIWPDFASRTLLEGGSVEEVARAIKGQRQKRLKRRGYIEEMGRNMRPNG